MRIRCEVPFCRRTAKRLPDDTAATRIICGKHWRLGDARYRKLYSMAKRNWKKTGTDRYGWLMHRAWERVRRQAIERAAGL